MIKVLVMVNFFVYCLDKPIRKNCEDSFLIFAMCQSIYTQNYIIDKEADTIRCANEIYQEQKCKNDK